MFLIFKTLVTALVVAGVSELAKRHTLLAAIVAALPIVSILIFCWVYIETKDTARVAALCDGIAWFILPTLVFFWVFPWLLKKGTGFMPSMLLALIPMAIAYAIFMWIKQRVN